MEQDPLRAALNEWTQGLDPVAARIRVFERVRDLPYQYPASRDPLEVLRSGRGSCSGKHYLLGKLFSAMGLRVKNMLCTHRFNESPLPFPDDMQEILRKNEIVDLHDYLQVQIDGQWVDVDCTWEKALRDFGFPVTDDWNGKSSMMLTVNPDETKEVNGDPSKAKDEMLSHLTHRQRTLRKQFLEALARWVEEIETESPRG